MNNVSYWKRALRLVFDLLFPINCIGCGQPETWLCAKCLSQIKSYSGEKMTIAGIDDVRIAVNYDDKLVQRAIHLLKYKSVGSLAIPLSTLLKMQIDEGNILIPVPLHPRRERLRGFNQAALIAEGLSGQIKNEVLVRRHYTKPQMKLNRAERLKNLDDAFQLKKPNVILGQDVILLDDVLTTGKTLKECAKSLRTGKPHSIKAVVLAHGK